MSKAWVCNNCGGVLTNKSDVWIKTILFRRMDQKTNETAGTGEHYCESCKTEILDEVKPNRVRKRRN